MKAPDLSPYSFAHHANGSCTASNTPGLKNSHYTAPNFVTPQANNALPLPEAVEHKPPMTDTTVESSAADNHRKQFGREGLGAGREVDVVMLTIYGRFYLRTLKKKGRQFE
jgi:hypothetical protein